MAVSAYPYPLGNITTRQAVELIADVVYPDANQIEARKRVRERIRYARKIGKLTPADSFSAPDFFRWALDENPDWAPLASVQGLPRSAIVVSMTGVCSISMSGKAYAVGIPGDPVKLREEFSRVEVERQKLTEKVAEQEKRIAELEAEVADWRERDRQLRAQRSNAGKKAWGNARTGTKLRQK
jgi:hypothetical protein